jgi:hypothetical protein
MKMTNKARAAKAVSDMHRASRVKDKAIATQRNSFYEEFDTVLEKAKAMKAIAKAERDRQYIIERRIKAIEVEKKATSDWVDAIYDYSYYSNEPPELEAKYE